MWLGVQRFSTIISSRYFYSIMAILFYFFRYAIILARNPTNPFEKDKMATKEFIVQLN